MTKYGFLGLGIMGNGMAANLVKAGYDVTVWNRSPVKCASLVAQGAKQAKTPEAVTASCDITFAMLADPEAAREVCFGPEGALAGIGEGRGYVDMSTVDEETVKAIAISITTAGGRFLESPVSGSKKPAMDGTLVILSAGDESLYKDAMPAFEKMGKMSFFLEKTGQAARMKLVVNMIMGSMMTALSEGVALCRKSGLNEFQLLEVLSNGALASPMVKGKMPTMLDGVFPTNFPLKHMQKDMRLAVSLGDRLSQPLPTAAAANELFKAARKAGLSDEDFAAVFKILS